MAYFSNGCEGEVFDAMCDKCVHHPGIDSPDQCPIQLLQLEWNYSQHNSEDQKLALDLLVPQPDGKTLCAFFQEKCEGDRYSCFTCGYLGDDCDHEGEVQKCPKCGTIEGDGFGLWENDPRNPDQE